MVILFSNRNNKIEKEIINILTKYGANYISDKIITENKDLLESLINGNQVVMEDPSQKKTTEERISELRKDLFSAESMEKGMTDLTFIEKALELRDTLIEAGETDPFLPVGRGVDITREDYEAAQFVADQFKECVEAAKGNSQVFTAELMRRTVDNGVPKAATKNAYRR